MTQRQLRLDEAVEGYDDEQLEGLIWFAQTAIPHLAGESRQVNEARLAIWEAEQTRRSGLVNA